MFTLLDPSLHVSHIFFSHRSIASTILTSCASSVPYGNERPYMSLSDLGLGPDREDSSWNRTMRSKPSVGIPVKIIKTFMCWKKHNQIGIHDPLWVFKSVALMHSKLQVKFLGVVESYCWWFRTPANPLICVSIPLFAGFWTSQVVISGFLNHQQSLYWL